MMCRSCCAVLEFQSPYAQVPQADPEQDSPLGRPYTHGLGLLLKVHSEEEFSALSWMTYQDPGGLQKYGMI